MTDLGTYESMDHAYLSLFMRVKTAGFRAITDGREVVEMRPTSFSITEPERGLYTGKDRRLNYRFWALETLCYIAGIGGRAHADLLTAVNSKYESFIRGDQLAQLTQYGPRVHAGLENVYKELLRDPYSRRAYLSLWDHGVDIAGDSAYCTTSMQFIAQPLSFWSGVQSGPPRLDMIVNMRSNDLNWGTPYDVGAFCAIHVAMAACLNFELGTYHHQAGSLHYYESGHNGERPPEFKLTIDSENVTSDYYDMEIPYPTERCGWHAVKETAIIICRSARAHLTSGGKMSEYKVPTFGMMSHMQEYAIQWEKFLRFSHGNGREAS